MRVPVTWPDWTGKHCHAPCRVALSGTALEPLRLHYVPGKEPAERLTEPTNSSRRSHGGAWMYRVTDSERITTQSETEGWSPEGLARAPIPQPAVPAEPRSERPAPTRAQPATPAPDVSNTSSPPTGRAIPMQAP